MKKLQAKMKETFRIETERIKSALRNRIDDLEYDLKSLQTKYDALTKSLEISKEINKCKDKKIAFQERTISTLRGKVSNLEENLKDSRAFEKLFIEAKEEISKLQASIKTERRRSIETSIRVKQDISSKMDMETGVLRKKLQESEDALRNVTRNLTMKNVQLRMKDRALNKFAMNVIRKNIGYWIRAWKERRDKVGLAVTQFQKNEASYVFVSFFFILLHVHISFSPGTLNNLSLYKVSTSIHLRSVSF